MAGKHRHVPDSLGCRTFGHNDSIVLAVGPSGSGTKRPERKLIKCSHCRRRRYSISYDWWSLVGLKLGINAIDEIGRGNYTVDDFLEAVPYDGHRNQEPTRHRRVT